MEKNSARLAAVVQNLNILMVLGLEADCLTYKNVVNALEVELRSVRLPFVILAVLCMNAC